MSVATKTSTKKPARRKTAGTKPKTGATRSATKVEEKIKTDLENMEREAAGLPPLRGGTRGAARPTPLHSRAAKLIKGRKVRHYAARGAVHLLLGGGAVLLYHGPKLAGKGGKWAGTRAGRRIIAHTQRRRWTKHTPLLVTDEHGNKKIRRTSTVCMGCGQQHASVQEMNRHYLEVHKDETPEPRTERKLPTIHKGATAKTAGKVIVKLHPEATRGPARHRHNRRNPAKTHVDRLVSKYQATVHQIGERSMSTGAAAPIARGFTQWADTMPPLEKKGAVLDVQEMMAGLERAMAVASDAFADVARELKRRNVAPEIVNASFANMQSDAENIGARATRFLANFNELYAPQIAMAKGNVATPSSRFFGQVS